MSYANYTLQNRRLETEGMERLARAGVSVVPNASILGMGLLRQAGVPVGGQGNWHPAPNDLRKACRTASDFCDAHNEKLEVVAIRWALENWAIIAESVGSRGDPASGLPWKRESIEAVGGRRIGVSVMGVSKIEELDETMRVWRSILDGLEGGRETAVRAGRWKGDHDWSLNRREGIKILASGIEDALGEYLDFAWASPDEGFVRAQK
jgi:D-arabinose 1-dehydrogenase